MFILDFNWLAVLVSAVVFMVVGALWYGPLFQKSWMRLSGMTEESARQGATQAYITMFFVAAVTSIVLAVFVKTLNATTFVDGMIVGFFLWLGFQATVMLNSVIFEKKPFALYCLNAGYNLIVIVIAGGLIAIW